MRPIKTTEPTRYELAAINGDRKILVGYTPRKNVAGIVTMLTETISRSETAPDGLSGRVEVIMRLRVLSEITGVDPNAWQTPPRGGGIEVRGTGGWKVAFTGRTQREVYGQGELTETIY